MTIVCVDDYSIALDGLTRSIRSILPDARIVTFMSVNEALDFVALQLPENSVQLIRFLNFSSMSTVQTMSVFPDISSQSRRSWCFSSIWRVKPKLPERSFHASSSIIWAISPSAKLIFSRCVFVLVKL